MALITRTGVASLSSDTPPQSSTIVGLKAGEALEPWDACYIKASDGKVWKSVGTAVNAAAKVRGFAFERAPVGEAVTLYFDVNARYGASLTPGADVYLSTTAGLLSDTATTGGTAPIGFVVDATRIRLFQSKY